MKTLLEITAMHLTSLQNIETNRSEEYHGWVDCKQDQTCINVNDNISKVLQVTCRQKSDLLYLNTQGINKSILED